MHASPCAIAVLGGVAVLAASVAARAQAPDPADLARIRQRLDVPSPVRDTLDATDQPTFRVSVSGEAVDIRRFWGAPDAVAPWVRPSGGPWHHEFTTMVTPDEFKGYGGIFTNGEKAVLAQQALISALLFRYLPGAIAAAVEKGRRRAARSEVRLALDEFYASHPEARPAAAGATPP